MSYFRKKIHSSVLADVLDLPEDLREREVSIVISPIPEDDHVLSATEIVENLTGVIPDEGITLEDYRMERLQQKYGPF